MVSVSVLARNTFCARRILTLSSWKCLCETFLLTRGILSASQMALYHFMNIGTTIMNIGRRECGLGKSAVCVSGGWAFGDDYVTSSCCSRRLNWRTSSTTAVSMDCGQRARWRRRAAARPLFAELFVGVVDREVAVRVANSACRFMAATDLLRIIRRRNFIAT